MALYLTMHTDCLEYGSIDAPWDPQIVEADSKSAALDIVADQENAFPGDIQDETVLVNLTRVAELLTASGWVLTIQKKEDAQNAV